MVVPEDGECVLQASQCSHSQEPSNASFTCRSDSEAQVVAPVPKGFAGLEEGDNGYSAFVANLGQVVAKLGPSWCQVGTKNEEEEEEEKRRRKRRRSKEKNGVWGR